MIRVNKSVILDDLQINRAITRISNEILERNLSGENLILLGIVNRGNIIADRINREIKRIEGFEVPVYSLDVSSYRDDVKREEPTAKLEIDLDDKIVILVDDVIYTGRTARAALDAVVDIGRPKKVQLVCLIDRGHRELPIRADYIGKNVPSSQNEKIKVRLLETDGVDAVEIIKQAGEI